MHHVAGVHSVNEISVRNQEWRNHDFAKYDAIIHVAAIVHQPHQQDRELYFHVNKDLAVDVCNVAISKGVKHFVFLSTMGVYGISPSCDGGGRITAQTRCQPKTMYGESKLAAEDSLLNLQTLQKFELSIIRPPMVYGANCPGNYFHRLLWMGKYLPFFPSVRKNILSMINVANLSELLKLIIEQEASGLYCPDDRDGVGTEERLQVISHIFGKNMHMSKMLGWPIARLPLRQLDSLYGDLFYDEGLQYFNEKYIIQSFTDVIMKFKNT